jgi:hypothetical protein
MAELKTQKNKASVAKFLDAIPDETRRKDAKEVLRLMREITGKKPVMWGTAIIGFDEYHYKSERSNQEGDWPMTAFSPRKQHLTIYIMPGFKKYDTLLKKLGKHKRSVSCLYINRLSDIHLPTLSKIIKLGYEEMKKKYRT